MTKIVYFVLMVLLLSGCTALVETYSELSGDGPASTSGVADGGSGDSGVSDEADGN